MTGRAQILSALDEVLDPCSVAVGKPIGIASLGLVESCTVENGEVDLVLCTTGPGCMLIGNLLQAADARIRSVAGVRDVRISVDTSIIWSTARMQKPSDNPIGSPASC